MRKQFITKKYGAFVINLDKYADIGTNWVEFYVKHDKVAYFDRFGNEHIPNKIKKSC